MSLNIIPNESNHNNAKYHTSIYLNKHIISSLHEVAKELFLHYINATCRNRLAEQTFYGRLLLLKQNQAC